MMGRVSDDALWLRPPPGSRVRQTRAHGPFVVQRREDLGLGSCRLTRHRDPLATGFLVLGYAERAETGFSCHVVMLEDVRDGEEYVVDTGIMGPGLPADAFAVEELTPPGALPGR
jgi:hypothetical protein